MGWGKKLGALLMSSAMAAVPIAPSSRAGSAGGIYGDLFPGA